MHQINCVLPTLERERNANSIIFGIGTRNGTLQKFWNWNAERNATEMLELERELERRVLWNDSCSAKRLGKVQDQK